MKNIFDLLKEYSVELPEDKKTDFEKALLENYKTVKDYDAQKNKLETAEAKVSAHETTINDLREDLKKFDGVDVTGLQNRITALETDLQNKIRSMRRRLQTVILTISCLRASAPRKVVMPKQSAHCLMWTR